MKEVHASAKATALSPPKSSSSSASSCRSPSSISTSFVGDSPSDTSSSIEARQALGGEGGTGLTTDVVELPLGGLGGGLGSWASCRGGVAGCCGGAGGCRTWGFSSGASSARLLQEQPIAAATTPARRAALGCRAAPWPDAGLMNRFLSSLAGFPSLPELSGSVPRTRLFRAKHVSQPRELAACKALGMPSKQASRAA